MVRLRRWWLVAAAVGVSVCVQQVVLTRRYDVSGHAAEHLGSASVPFFAFVVVVAVLVATPQARRQPAVVAALAAWFGVTVLVLIGNVRVVDALIDAGMAHTPTSQLVDNDAVAAAHGLADAAPWWGVAAALAVVAALWRGGHVSPRVAVAAGVVSLVFPPWIVPGAGLVVLAVARVIAHEREAKQLIR